ncbi:DEAD-box ATP-dependent RNA helicase 30 isoform X2 [Eurytemora carolleeae]|uniref:DEAD-box ATP-dependent RNA helicase 30 isoform X2 n=1 Tax=Eurytemora carolleeae TaxID=1294199 RepID=UPI000C7870B1|nr:DEAD-box ATP-dependent RNA helicase 30 isoform X2 [Eurytemora carolleeae]|eukprot:XP_023327112.1 DEAD-box ATP-dependent RNA helicase 30-like isoform X2 [Eurytemora affinis]
MSGYPPHPFLGYPQGSTGVPAPGYAQAPTSGYHQVASGGLVGPPGNAQYYSQVGLPGAQSGFTPGFLPSASYTQGGHPGQVSVHHFSQPPPPPPPTHSSFYSQPSPSSSYTHPFLLQQTQGLSLASPTHSSSELPSPLGGAPHPSLPFSQPSPTPVRWSSSESSNPVMSRMFIPGQPSVGAEVHGQYSDNRTQHAGDRGQYSDNRSQHAGDRGQYSGDRSQSANKNEFKVPNEPFDKKRGGRGRTERDGGGRGGGGEGGSWGGGGGGSNWGRGGEGGPPSGSRWTPSPSFRAAPSPSGADLQDFGDMGAAARSYSGASKSKGESGFSRVEDMPRHKDTNQYRLEHGLTVFDRSASQSEGLSLVPDPFQRFQDFPGITPQQLNCFLAAGFTTPTPIQAQSWPIAMKDRDLISIAKTGSGKTLAFLLPAFKKMDARSSGGRERNKQINCLVLAPTRELATQIQEEAVKFEGAGYKSACAYGGAPKKDQLRCIQGANILVATPGRLLDFLEGGQVDLSGVFYLVMDEADRMLDMGFEPQIRDILKKVPKRRQTLMFSATWPEDVRRLAQGNQLNKIMLYCPAWILTVSVISSDLPCKVGII